MGEVLGSGFDALRQATERTFRGVDATQRAGTDNLKGALWSDCGAMGCRAGLEIVLGSRDVTQWVVKVVEKRFWGADVTQWLVRDSLKQILRAVGGRFKGPLGDIDSTWEHLTTTLLAASVMSITINL